MTDTDISAIRELLLTPQRILITTHTNPDGDAMGASLALYGYLRKKGHSVQVVAPDPFPAFLSWMPFSGDVIIYNLDQGAGDKAIDNAGIIFCLDFNDLTRLDGASGRILKSGAAKVLIDHHLYPSSHFSLKISRTDTSSTCELIYDFIDQSGDSELINPDIAACIYTGIITDTGSFSYACNYPKTYDVVARLIRTGIDGEHIHRLIYDTYSEERLRLLGFSLSEKLCVLPEYHTAYISLSAGELRRFNYRIGDTEGIVNYALSIDGIHLAALFTEREGKIKISFRSKGSFSVEEIARIHFQGGGHGNASGGTSFASMDETIGLFLGLLPRYREKLKTVY